MRAELLIAFGCLLVRTLRCLTLQWQEGAQRGLRRPIWARVNTDGGRTHAMTRRQQLAVGLGMVVLVSARVSWAGALGIPLDGFLTTFQTFVVGLGLIMGLVGLTGYIGSLFDNPFSNILAGSIGFFTKAGLLGGGVTLMGLLGLVGGGTL